jgi:ferredoxin
MVKIIQNREECIGCGTCEALCPTFWKTDFEKGKADLLGARKNPETGEFELEVEEIGCNQGAADACPVGAIKIKPT